MVDPTGPPRARARQPLQDQLARDWAGCRPLAAGDDDVFARRRPATACRATCWR